MSDTNKIQSSTVLKLKFKGQSNTWATVL